MAHYVGKVEVPPQVLDKIGGYDAWTALSWMLQHQWVQDTKWLIGRKENRLVIAGGDVGTPFTVDQMLAPETSKYRDLLPYGLEEFLRRVPEDRMQEFKRLMIEGYLLGTDYVSDLWVLKPGGRDKGTDLVQTGAVTDANGRNQLEGELRRYWIKERFIFDPRHWRFPVLMHIITHFCDKNDLPDSKQKFAEKLGVS